MEEKNLHRAEIDRFLLAEIDSIPHLEALLLLWNSRPRRWPVEELSRGLYVPLSRAQAIVHDLREKGMIVVESDECAYNDAYRHDSMVAEIDSAYRQELVRITNLVHSKASSAVRDFARAFKLKKD